MVNTITTIFVDFGGVILSENGHTFLDTLVKIYNKPKNILDSIQNKYREKLRKGEITEKDFLEKIATHVGKKYKKEDSEFLWETLGDNKNEFNYELFDILQHYRKLGYRVIVISDSYPPLKEINVGKGYYDSFDDVILSCDIGLSKKDDDIKIFEYALERSNIKAEESIFIDDREKNCSIAAKVGIKSIMHKNNIDTIKKINSIFNKYKNNYKINGVESFRRNTIKKQKGIKK